MKTVKICYTDAKNIGDAINPLIVKQIFGYKPILSDIWNCEITGIGSGLRRFFISSDKVSFGMNSKYYFMNRTHKEPVIIWSAGFLSTPSESMRAVRGRYCVSSVRGLLSKRAIEKMNNNTIYDCTVGDAGILASMLLPNKESIRYKIGIIPHRSEKGLPIVQKLRDAYANAVIIDIEQDDPIEGLRQISKCNYILSSSLHGLIFADSFRIPNRHVVLSDKLSGDGFKFKDYYSAYQLEDTPLDIRNNDLPDIENVISGYSITDEQVYTIQENCRKSFLKYLK